MTNGLSRRAGSRHNLAGILLVGVAALLLAPALPSAALARDDGPIDQSTLQPPLNPNFTYTCVRERDREIRCSGTWDPTYQNEPSGLSCGDKDLRVRWGP